MEITTYTSADVAAALAKVLPTASDRSVRLFSLACLRRVRHLLGDTFCNALDVAESHADGRVSDVELGEAVTAVKRASGRRRSREWAVYHAVRYVKGSPQANAANIAAWAAEIARDSIALPERPEQWTKYGNATYHLFDWDIDGGPSGPPKISMNEVRALEQAAEAGQKRREDAEEAKFQQARADAASARLAAYAGEIVAQLKLIEEIF